MDRVADITELPTSLTIPPSSIYFSAAQLEIFQVEIATAAASRRRLRRFEKRKRYSKLRVGG